MQVSIERFVEDLRRVLPADWQVAAANDQLRRAESRADAILSIRAPDGAEARLAVEVLRRVSAKKASIAISKLDGVVGEIGLDGAIVFTRFVSRMARERLRRAGVSYIDSTGNVWIAVSRPAVLIERQGAEKDPDPPRRGLRSLKGAKAARIVRALCDWRPPVGVRELARRTGSNPGYVTRVLSFLEEEETVARNDRGTVSDVRWLDLLRLWSTDYTVAETNRAVRFLAPRGLPSLRERLSSYPEQYAVTGPLAVPPEAQVIPSRVFTCYMRSPELAGRKLDLRPAKDAGNVTFLEPFDDVVFERTREMDGLITVAITQCLMDLLTGTGRDPAQAEALISWMMDHEEDWRA